MSLRDFMRAAVALELKLEDNDAPAVDDVDALFLNGAAYLRIVLDAYKKGSNGETVPTPMPYISWVKEKGPERGGKAVLSLEDIGIVSSAAEDIRTKLRADWQAYQARRETVEEILAYS